MVKNKVIPISIGSRPIPVYPFPIPIKEIVLIEDAHTAVSRGCLSEAMLVEEENAESES